MFQKYAWKQGIDAIYVGENDSNWKKNEEGYKLKLVCKLIWR